MKIFHCIFITALFVLLIQSGFAQTNISAGDVSGTWTKANALYLIDGEITIPTDSTLMIEPGVEVNFQGHYKFNVQGRLLAIGTKQDTIRFTAENKVNGWHGIRFNNTENTNDTSKIVYCSMKYGKANTGIVFDRCGGAIMIKEFDKVFIFSCLFDSNSQQGGPGLTPPEAGPAIYIYNASPIITNSTFTNHTGSKGSAVGCISSPKAIISNNKFTKNTGALVGAVVTFGIGSPIISGNFIFNNSAGSAGGGISIEMGASPRIENNIIVNNKVSGAGGIFCWTNTKAIIMNNTIANNIASNAGGGISCNTNSSPILINNIIYGNSAPTGSQVSIVDAASDPIFLYNDIEVGKNGFGGNGAGSNYTGIYENNIDHDPSFKNVVSNDYSLSDSSICIGAGIDSIEISGVWYKAPSYCFNGILRPSPNGTMPDIGAYENLSGISLYVFVRQSSIDKRYARVNIDSVLFRTRFLNPSNLQFKSYLIHTNSDSTQIDSLTLYDDGIHSDSSANDGLYAVQIHPRLSEDFYSLSVSTIDNQSQNYILSKDKLRFTTAGPVILDSIPFGAVPGFKFGFKPYLKNMGTVKTINNIKLKLSSNDAWITSITPIDKNYPNIQPGQTVGGAQIFTVAYDTASFPGHFNFRFEVSSDDYIYWVVDTTIIVKPTEVENDLVTPSVFKLDQNYPNPFNPTTKISYAIPLLGGATRLGEGQAEAGGAGLVTLKVFDVLGNEVATLVEEFRPAGSYEVEFSAESGSASGGNAYSLASGIYFYQLKVGEFISTKKMVLIR